MRIRCQKCGTTVYEDPIIGEDNTINGWTYCFECDKKRSDEYTMFMRRMICLQDDAIRLAHQNKFLRRKLDEYTKSKDGRPPIGEDDNFERAGELDDAVIEIAATR